LPIVISNSSPIINLAIIGRMELLKKLWGKIYIPQGVWEEIVIEGKGFNEVEEIKKADWFIIEKVKNYHLVISLMQFLDKGESEAIALAVERNADFILLDEIDAREVADIYNLKKTGVLGILILAKLRNEIPLLRVEIEKLRKKANFWIKDSLIESVLQKVGE